MTFIHSPGHDILHWIERAEKAEARVAALTLKLSNVHANLTRAEEERDDALTWIERCADQTRRAEKAEARLAVAIECLEEIDHCGKAVGGNYDTQRARAALAKVREEKP